jgi:hypothetical protein
MKQRASRLKSVRRSLNDIVGFGTKYTIFSEYWQSQKEGDGLEIARVRDFELDDDPESLDLDELGPWERNALVYRALEGEPFMIFVDVSPSLTDYDEKSLSYSKAFIRDIAVAILINSAYQMMTPAGLVLFSDRIERVYVPQSGEYVRYILDQFLTFEVQEKRGTSLACIEPYLREFQDAIIFIVSDFQDEALDTSPFWGLNIEGLDIIPVIVRDPLEKAVLGGGASFICHNPESGKDFPVHITEKYWREIRRASAHFYRSLFRRFSQLQKGYIILDSADVDKCHQSLQQFFAKRGELPLHSLLSQRS